MSWTRRIFSYPRTLATRLFRWLERFWHENTMAIVTTSLLLLFLIAFFWQNIFITIDAGHAGVYWKRLNGGVVLNRVMGEGLHIIPPWNRIYIYDIRVQELNHTVEFLDANGLEISVGLSTRFFPVRSKLPILHQHVGPDYRQKVVIPELVSALRYVLGGKPFQEIYAQEEEQLIDAIRSPYSKRLAQYDLTVDDVLITGVELPPEMKEAVEKKLVNQQEMQAYAYILERERKELDRKRIEGEGVAAFQQASGVSILQWQGIKATESFAKSPNAKIVIMGNNGGSLPVILSDK